MFGNNKIYFVICRYNHKFEHEYRGSKPAATLYCTLNNCKLKKQTI